MRARLPKSGAARKSSDEQLRPRDSFDLGHVTRCVAQLERAATSSCDQAPTCVVHHRLLHIFRVT